MSDAKHCLICGETHSGKCSPDAFADLKCNKCGQVIDMPWDAVLICGTSGIQCGCGETGSFEVINPTPTE